MTETARTPSEGQNPQLLEELADALDAAELAAAIAEHDGEWVSLDELRREFG